MTDEEAEAQFAELIAKVPPEAWDAMRQAIVEELLKYNEVQALLSEQSLEE